MSLRSKLPHYNAVIMLPIDIPTVLGNSPLTTNVIYGGLLVAVGFIPVIVCYNFGSLPCSGVLLSTFITYLLLLMLRCAVQYFECSVSILLSVPAFSLSFSCDSASCHKSSKAPCSSLAHPMVESLASRLNNSLHE